MLEKFILTEYSVQDIENSKKLLDYTISLFGIRPEAYGLANFVANQYPWAAEMAEEAASKTNCDPIEIMIANLSYDLLWGSIGCSTIVKQTAEGPYVARNMDWFPPSLIAKASAILPTKNGLNAATPGLFGVVTGLSNSGFALILNAAFASKNDYTNIPMLLLLRQVLDNAVSYDNAFNILTTTPIMSGGLITLVGTTNEQICVIERTPTTCAIRYPENGQPLVVTNHYRKLVKPDDTCERYDYLIKNKHTDSVILLENVAQSITSQHIFIKPALNFLKLFVPENIPEEQEGDFDNLMEMIV